MVNVKRAIEQIGPLALMKFFPPKSEEGARTALVGMICEMASNNEQIEWLVRRALTLYNEWPGPRELRALFCSRYKPADGIEARSTVYLSDEGGGGGFPRESQTTPQVLTPGRDEARRLLARVARDK